MTGDGDGKWENLNPPTDGPPRVSHATFSTSSPPTPDTPGTDCHGTNPVKLITEATPPLPPPFHGATHRVPSSFGWVGNWAEASSPVVRQTSSTAAKSEGPLKRRTRKAASSRQLSTAALGMLHDAAAAWPPPPHPLAKAETS